MEKQKDKTVINREKFLKLALMGSGGLALATGAAGVITSCKNTPSSEEPTNDQDKNNDNKDNSNDEEDNSQDNKYAVAGEKLLDSIIDKFYKSSKGLYAQKIDGQTFAKSNNPSFLWPYAHLLPALMWGTLINESKYKSRLKLAIKKLNWYRGSEAYGVRKNSEAYFDDNGLLGNMLMDIYVRVLQNQDVLDKSLTALNYGLKYRDKRGGLPQRKNGLGKGIFHVGSVNGLANGFVKYYPFSKNPDHLDIAKTYFKKFNDYKLKLKNPKTNLLIGGTQYINGKWVGDNVGPRPGSTDGVITLGVSLYKITKDTDYLTKSRTMANAVVNKWHKKNGGLHTPPYWGGPGTLDILCEMHHVDKYNTKWYATAKDIIDFLINHGQDKEGFYPGGKIANKNRRARWDDDLSNSEPPEEVKLQGQACAAQAILRFAHLDLNK